MNISERGICEKTLPFINEGSNDVSVKHKAPWRYQQFAQGEKLRPGTLEESWAVKHNSYKQHKRRNLVSV